MPYAASAGDGRRFRFAWTTRSVSGLKCIDGFGRLICSRRRSRGRRRTGIPFGAPIRDGRHRRRDDRCRHHHCRGAPVCPLQVANGLMAHCLERSLGRRSVLVPGYLSCWSSSVIGYPVVKSVIEFVGCAVSENSDTYQGSSSTSSIGAVESADAGGPPVAAGGAP